MNQKLRTFSSKRLSEYDYKNIYFSVFGIFALFLLSACTPDLANNADVTPITAVPTVNSVILCERGQDGLNAVDERIDALRSVYERNANCDSDIHLLLYEAYVELGDLLTSGGDTSAAIDAYETALFYNEDGIVAQEQLAILQNSENTERLATCADGVETEELSSYEAASSDFATLTATGFVIDGDPYPVYGVNYYPLNTPFGLFLTETQITDIEPEFELMRDAGLNTLRLFLRPEDLFACDAAVPIVEHFERLDNIIQLASEYEFRLIPVLHQDLAPRVLYFEDFVLEQTRFIIERYQDEATILAWDVRDSGDVDYRDGFIRQDIALRWLADTIVMIRQVDNQHPITIGFWQDSLVTAPLVDFVSFQFYGDYEDLRQEIANLRGSANRPILLTSIGYSTFNVSEITQRNLLFQAFEEVEQNGLMGWMVNHTFDYPRTVTCTPPDCPGSGGEINQFGLWNTGYFPKLALDVVRIATGVSE